MNDGVSLVALAKTEGPADIGVEPVGQMLELLSAVESAQPLSQRNLAARLGIALGLANALIRRCVNKGLIKISEAPTRRYAYYLTPAGFAEKTHLVGEYIAVSLNFFRSARAEYVQRLSGCAARGQTRALLVGTGELAEIALLAAEDSGAHWVGVLDAARNLPKFHHLAVVRDLDEAPEFDVAVLADAKDAQATFAQLSQCLPPDRIVVPSFLHLSPRDPR